MKPRDSIDLLLLAAIWGSSFLFMKVAVPEFGAVPLAFVRVALAALALMAWLAWRGEAAVVARRAPQFLLLGLTNSALPFALFGYAAFQLPAGVMSIFNAATPLATALIAWLWLGQKLPRLRSLGLALGFAGVAGLAVVKSLRSQGSGLSLSLDHAAALAILACLGATLLYGHAANYTKKVLGGSSSWALSAGSQAGAAVALALPAWLLWPTQPPSARAWAMALLLALLCTGLAYTLYFRLLNRVGPTPAASVTFLIPVFAMLWGWVFLGEPVTLAMLLGGGVILAGTAIALGLWPRSPMSP